MGHNYTGHNHTDRNYICHNYEGVAACDVDGDGDEEIYVLNTDSYGGAKQFSDRLFATTQKGGMQYRNLFSLAITIWAITM